ncbi:MAG: M20/M25/M40 family metallo-hydrolase, partial [Propionibacteriaceae bacterium]|nr:M20/M25/M40 family metallo-hydrolase [Propionibacteriaceae bacterium]
MYEQRLSRALQFPTVSNSDYTAVDFAPYEAYIAFLQEAFPLFFQTCEWERINEYGLLFRWKGQDPTREPILLLAHYDVVPADDEGWTYPPFSGTVADGYIWGRGTIDIKSQQIAHFEAVEQLIKSGFTPAGDIYFAYGHDEEVGGEQGADEIAQTLQARGLRFAGVLDEGGIVVSGALKGVTSPVALIGVGEKGRAEYAITVAGRGGHASMPPATTALGQIAEVVRRIEKNPLPTRLTPPVLALLNAVSSQMGKPVELALEHLNLSDRLVRKILSLTPETNAMIRTTFAATMAKASDAGNVLPASATVNIDVRLLAGDTVDSVEAYFRKLAGRIPVEIRRVTATEATDFSPTSGVFYDRLFETTQRIFPEAITTPYLVCGGTDSRKYDVVSDHIYRFTPLHVTNAEKDTMHNRNEHVSIASFDHM